MINYVRIIWVRRCRHSGVELVQRTLLRHFEKPLRQPLQRSLFSQYVQFHKSFQRHIIPIEGHYYWLDLNCWKFFCFIVDIDFLSSVARFDCLATGHFKKVCWVHQRNKCIKYNHVNIRCISEYINHSFYDCNQRCLTGQQ